MLVLVEMVLVLVLVEMILVLVLVEMILVLVLVEMILVLVEMVLVLVEMELKFSPHHLMSPSHLLLVSLDFLPFCFCTSYFYF